MTQTDILQQFKQLDTSSPLFPDQLTSLLYKKEYKDCIPNIPDEDVVWLVNYLDDACLYLSYPLRRSSLDIHRFSNLFKQVLPVPRSGGAYVNSGGSAVPDNDYPSRTYSKVLSQTSADTQSPLEVLVMSTKASSTAPRFA